jgi:hypothetical protein
MKLSTARNAPDPPAHPAACDARPTDRGLRAGISTIERGNTPIARSAFLLLAVVPAGHDIPYVVL